MSGEKSGIHKASVLALLNTAHLDLDNSQDLITDASHTLETIGQETLARDLLALASKIKAYAEKVMALWQVEKEKRQMNESMWQKKLKALENLEVAIVALISAENSYHYGVRCSRDEVERREAIVKERLSAVAQFLDIGVDKS